MIHRSSKLVEFSCTFRIFCDSKSSFETHSMIIVELRSLLERGRRNDWMGQWIIFRIRLICSKSGSKQYKTFFSIHIPLSGHPAVPLYAPLRGHDLSTGPCEYPFYMFRSSPRSSLFSFSIVRNIARFTRIYRPGSLKSNTEHVDIGTLERTSQMPNHILFVQLARWITEWWDWFALD
jgi:hypothetical protein